MPLRFPPPTYSPGGLRSRGGGRGINCARSPTPPHDLPHEVTARSNDVGKPTIRDRSGSIRMPRRGGGGPRLTARPVARVGEQTILSTWRHAIGPPRWQQGSVSDTPPEFPPRLSSSGPSLEKIRLSTSRPRRRPRPSSRVCAGKVETVEAPQGGVRGASPASGTTVGVMGHG